jgi:hypothetical protein
MAVLNEPETLADLATRLSKIVEERTADKVKQLETEHREKRIADAKEYEGQMDLLRLNIADLQKKLAFIDRCPDVPLEIKQRVAGVRFTGTENQRFNYESEKWEIDQ